MCPAVVTSIERVLVAVQSTDRAAERWRSLGFTLSEAGPWEGCTAADLDLSHGGIRLISPDGGTTIQNGFAGRVREHLARRGEGLTGWTWGRPHSETEDHGLIDPDLTPGALTMFETARVGRGPTTGMSRQRNRTTSVDHIVIATGEVDRVASAYARAFSLRPHGKEMKGRRFAFLKVGGPVIEITGPLEPAPHMAPALWGLALRSEDLEETVAVVRTAAVEVSDPKPAIQGGRIASLREPVSGVPLAWLESETP